MLALHHNDFNGTCFVAGFVCSRSAHSSGGAMENIFIKKERTVAMNDCINKVVTKNDSTLKSHLAVL